MNSNAKEFNSSWSGTSPANNYKIQLWLHIPRFHIYAKIHNKLLVQDRTKPTATLKQETQNTKRIQIQKHTHAFEGREKGHGNRKKQNVKSSNKNSESPHKVALCLSNSERKKNPRRKQRKQSKQTSGNQSKHILSNVSLLAAVIQKARLLHMKKEAVIVFVEC